jgi:transcriptional regulator with XRE-family HTH domain
MTRLKEILDEEGRKQTWLAEKTGLSAGAINNYAHGLHCPDDKKQLIADVLGRDVADVFPDKQVAA